MNPFSFITKRFPVEAIIIEGFNSNHIKHDRMRRVVDKNTGHEFYTFKSSKGEYVPVPYSKMIPSDKGLVVILYSPASGQYFLVNIVMDYIEKEVITAKFENNKLIEEKKMVNVPVVKPYNESIRQVAPVIHRYLDAQFHKKSFMEKYGAIILIVVWAVAILLPMIFYPAYLDAVSKNAAGVANQISNMLSQLGVASSQISHVVPPTTPPPA